ncbi:MAG TPA: hypothetical protein VK192_14105 [Sphingomicrobium sp.]|nr:hypothetical protein [Sphingomicrobium sp.]HLO22043.1 hypothetical protein [Methyloceanibacter sp.]
MAAEYLIRLRPVALTFFALAATLPCVLAAKGVAPGPYECWFHNTPQPLKNFTLKDGTYIDASGVSGSVTVSGKELKFSSGNLDGRTGIYNGGNPPTISFYNADGEEVLLCQRGSYNKGVRKQ